MPGESEPESLRDRVTTFVRRHRRRIVAGLGVAGFVAVVYLLVAWLTWPDVAALENRNPESTAFIDRYLERSGSSAAWTWVPASRISPHLKEAVLVGEDLEFFSHEGFSAHEIRQAIRQAVEEMEPPRGASTITQQLAKNLWLSPSRSPTRKAKEVLLTRQLEKHLSKNRILEIYLNVVEFGPGVYGAEAAARRYFAKSASGLTPREAAMLAAALPRPRQWHPGVGSANYARRVETLLARMRQVTFLDARLGLGGDPGEPVPDAPEEVALDAPEEVAPDAPEAAVADAPEDEVPDATSDTVSETTSENGVSERAEDPPSP